MGYGWNIVDAEHVWNILKLEFGQELDQQIWDGVIGAMVDRRNNTSDNAIFFENEFNLV